MKLLLLIGICLLNSLMPERMNLLAPFDKTPLLVRKCQDFSLTGKGDHPEWAKAAWHMLHQLDSGGQHYESKFKILYSDKGIYVLFNGADQKITTPYDQDFDDLFKGDVFEVFFHPHPEWPLYFEYEVNQLNKELVLLIPNFNGASYGWLPWHYNAKRRVDKKVHIAGGTAAPGSVITAWSAELFFPYELLHSVSGTIPQSGTVWNANFYRLDYDSGNMIKWAWSPVEKSFHEYKKFGSIRFE